MKYSETYIEGNHSVTNGGPVIITPKGILLHHTGEYSEKSIRNTFTNRTSYASAHVLILKNGDRVRFGEDDWKMWHAGKSEFKSVKHCNNFMLGVEFQGDTNKAPLTDEQIESFIEWAKPRIEKYSIALSWITDHRTVSPGRKTDLKKEEFEKVIFRLSNAEGIEL
jgi:N-acetylmuramoyl-L-alanine amidase